MELGLRLYSVGVHSRFAHSQTPQGCKGQIQDDRFPRHTKSSDEQGSNDPIILALVLVVLSRSKHCHPALQVWVIPRGMSAGYR